METRMESGIDTTTISVLRHDPGRAKSSARQPAAIVASLTPFHRSAHEDRLIEQRRDRQFLGSVVWMLGSASRTSRTHRA